MFLISVNLLWIICILSSLKLFQCGQCPQSNTLNPCKCSNDTISCGGNVTIHLKAIFHRMSYELGDGKKHFQKFYLNNTAISELPENTFEDITFDSIQIVNAYNLSLIHTFAFSATNLALKNFYVANTLLKNSPPNYDIFTAMSLMFGIEGITIVYSKIQNIPDNAFRPILGQQKNLTVIYMYGNIIKMIGNNAFQYLPSLFILEIHSNQINYIPKNAFKFLGKSLRNFHYGDLSPLPLNSSSFEYGAFSNFN